MRKRDIDAASTAKNPQRRWRFSPRARGLK
jgi:hypothetical protein